MNVNIIGVVIATVIVMVMVIWLLAPSLMKMKPKLVGKSKSMLKSNPKPPKRKAAKKKKKGKGLAKNIFGKPPELIPTPVSGQDRSSADTYPIPEQSHVHASPDTRQKLEYEYVTQEDGYRSVDENKPYIHNSSHDSPVSDVIAPYERRSVTHNTFDGIVHERRNRARTSQDLFGSPTNRESVETDESTGPVPPSEPSIEDEYDVRPGTLLPNRKVKKSHKKEKKDEPGDRISWK